MLYLRPFTWVLILFGLFVVYRALSTPVRGLDNHEAWVMWITHDSTPIIGTPRDIVSAMRVNMSDMVALWRENLTPPLYLALLDLWRMVVGANLVWGRWLSSLMSLLAFAVTLRATHRMRFEGKRSDTLFLGLLFAYPAATIGAESLIMVWCALGMWAHVGYRQTHQWQYRLITVCCLLFIIASAPFWHVNMILALLAPPLAMFTLRIMHLKPDDTIHVSYNPIITTTALFFICSFIIYQLLMVWVRQDWQSIIKQYSAERNLTQPIVLIYPQYHPLAYYDRTETIRFGRGATVNLGWREFSDAELEQIAGALAQSDTFWMVAPNGERQSEVLARLLRSHNRVLLANINGMMPQRFTRR
jgi:hypothetical protein